MAIPTTGNYWIGSDGNIYARSSSFAGVQNLGQASASDIAGASAGKNIVTGTPDNGYFLAPIADPNPPKTTNTPPPSGGGTGTPLDTGAVSNTNLAIQQLPSLLSSALGSENNNYTNTVGSYDAAQKQQQDTHDASTTTNQQNYDSNFMDSIRSGIKGLGNLVSLLRGTGAGGGTAEDQVHDVVGGVTSDDIRSGADTQQANQATLDSTLGQFLTDLKGKRAAADDTHANNISAINRDSQTQLQDLYSKLAGYYSSAGDTADASKYTDQAGSLTPSIAANSKTQTTAYDTTPVAVQSPTLTAFTAPTAPNVATLPADGQVGSGIFTMNKRKADNTPTVPDALPTTPVAAAQGA